VAKDDDHARVAPRGATSANGLKTPGRPNRAERRRAELPASRARPAKPAALTLAALGGRPIWVGWRQETRAGRLTKVPYDPRTGRRAASDDPGTWATRDEADWWTAKERADGIGLMFCPVDGGAFLCGIDLDSCRDLDTDITPWAQEIVDRFDSYSEVSPSGAGVKVFFAIRDGDLGAVETLFDGKYGRAFKNGGGGDHPPAIEVYRGKRYFTVTEEAIGPTDELRLVDLADLRWLICEAGPKFAGEAKRGNGEDTSRSAAAWRAGVALKAEGAVYEQMRDALLAHEDPDIAEWARTKGLDNGERELRRIYDKADAGELVTIRGVEKRLTTLADLNERFALLHAPGSASVYISRPDFLPIQDIDLKRRLAAETVRVCAPDGRVSYASAFNYWTGHAQRHLYRHIVFAPAQQPPDAYNLYRGLGVTPCEGCCERIVAHVRDVVCSGNPTDADAMLKLLAWQIQNIGKPSRIIVVLKSEVHQAGKGILLGEVMLKIYGPSGFAPSTVDQVLGKFNDAIRGRSFLFLDEVLFAGDRRSADAIKRLSTTDRYGIETKNLPVVLCPIAVNLWLASNHTNAAFIEEHDARYWALAVGEHRVGDNQYFTDLLYEIENGGREAFAHYLLNMDVSDFMPWRDVPKDNAVKREMIQLSVNPYDARKWIGDCCYAERLIGCPDGNGGWVRWKQGDEHGFYALLNAYVEWQKTVRTRIAPEPTQSSALGKVLTEAGFGSRRTASGMIRTLPDPTLCLERLYQPECSQKGCRHGPEMQGRVVGPHA